ncbi:hypothetical protein EDB83DRAFT_2524300 [Lactarius deliciosus]|nr:hypothetical protein EDB83DRAFT_2524300 [Lactarius deliciosus]
MVSLSQSDKDGMRQVWNSQFKAQRHRKMKLKNKPSLAISKAHHAQLYLHSDMGDQEIQEGSGAHNDNFYSDSDHSREDAMEQNSEQEFDNDDDDDSDGDAPPPLSLTHPNTSTSPPPPPTPDLPTAHQTAHDHGLNAPIKSTISALESTTTPPESSAQAQAHALKSSTQPSGLITQPPKPTLLSVAHYLNRLSALGDSG